ncbi:tRNA(Met) cytidine acetyltransferase TmcA [Bisgaard Taxon 46]
MKQADKQRYLQFWVGDDSKLSHQLATLPETKSAVWIGDNLPPFLSFPLFPFSKAKNLLGQEFVLIVYDARVGLNLDVLAIASGTLQQGGTLIVLLNKWRELAQWQDPDSLRWSGENLPILTPHFIHYFQQKVEEYGFPIYHTDFPQIRLPNCVESAVDFQQKPTTEQRQLLQKINDASEDVLIVTAKRGRGKSTLAGFWAKRLMQRNQSLILTAPNKSAVNILQDFAEAELDFMPPDLLCEQIDQNPNQFAGKWLLIDEAAMIPLNLLQQLTLAFKRILCTTTIQSYEGTGRGFLLKFLANLHRTFVHFELHQPLRWAIGDKLEAFIDELLMLNAEDDFLGQSDLERAIQIQSYSQNELVNKHKIAEFYGLLTLAHYRTSPLDLRRLFDAPKQQFYLAETSSELIGGVWLVEEGDIQSDTLILDIARGVRRPRGNLVAQALCYQGNLQQACRLSSLRISRIAIQPDCQQQGIGQQLINEISQNAGVDFLSVSFGYTEQLAQFWQKCGFNFVHLGEQKEASSGCYSVIALKPLTVQGKQLCQQAKQQFERNVGLSFHPIATQFPSNPDWALTEQDLQMLQHFADFHGSLAGSTAAIQRLATLSDSKDCPALTAFLNKQQCVVAEMGGKKNWLKICREEVNKILQNHTFIL